MIKKVVLLGSGGQCKVAIDLIDSNTEYEIVAILDDYPGTKGTKTLGYEVVGGIDKLSEYDPETVGFIVCYGDNYLRKSLFDKCVALGYQPLNIIASTTKVSKYASIGKGVVIGDNCAILPSATIGDNVLIGPMSSVSHDCVVEAHVHLSTGVRLAGRTYISELADLGTSVAVIPGVRIGKGSIMGAGAVAVKNIDEFVLAVGIPAKAIKSVKDDK